MLFPLTVSVEPEGPGWIVVVRDADGAVQPHDGGHAQGRPFVFIGPYGDHRASEEAMFVMFRLQQSVGEGQVTEGKRKPADRIRIGPPYTD